MASLRGWLLDVYAHPGDGVVLWLLGDDGERHRLRHAFPAVFYAHGPNHQLRQLWAFLRDDSEPIELGRARRRDLFAGELDVLEARLPHAARQPAVYYRAKERFPDLSFYDADVVLPVRYGAATGVFPLARVEALSDGDGNVAHIRPLDSRWEVEPHMPLLRVMTIEPDVMPSHREPHLLTVRMGRSIRRLTLDNPRATLERLGRMLDGYDPDLLFAAWGDRWLFPKLFELAEQYRVPFNPNRDKSLPPDRRKENSYYTYGQVVYRAEQTFLYGRWHIDPKNAMMYGEYDLRGVLEQARVSGLPVQEVARKSPGSGITAMQMRTAMQNGVLVPHLKQEPERFKNLEELIGADWGGMVYQPLTGLHEHVGAIDFFSMYPSIMEHFNISPETVGVPGANPLHVPMSGMPVNQDEPGLIPEVVRPILEKRWEIKRRLRALGPHDAERRMLKAQSDALKWLLVVSFGYLGYKNARWGKIESHEAVTAFSRELLLQAKEVSEAHGFRVLHMYVDGLYICKQGARRAEDFNEVVAAIAQQTRLAIELDGVFRWIAFLPSRQDARLPVPNRFFGVFDDGRTKMRGIETRRHDTPVFIHKLQLWMLERLAQAQDRADLAALLPELVGRAQHTLADLRAGRIPLEEMLVRHTISRELDEYKGFSAAAMAARRLVAAGKHVRPGQQMYFLHARGARRVYAWDVPGEVDRRGVDVSRYETLLLRAAHTVLQVFGVSEAVLGDWLFARAGYITPPGVLREGADYAAPLWSEGGRRRRELEG